MIVDIMAVYLPSPSPASSPHSPFLLFLLLSPSSLETSASRVRRDIIN